jgi:hypothetical protein
MRFRVELSREAQKHLSQFPRDVRERLEHAIDEFEEKDDSQWSNIKSLQGSFSGNIQSAARWKFPPYSSDPKTPIDSAQLDTPHSPAIA